jgi:hypothetical protein
VSAGQIDALYVDTAGLYYLIDFKRVESKNILDPSKAATRRGFKGACGLPPIDHVPDTNYQHYSLQTSIYNLMLLDTHGIDVGDRMYLLRMHSDREKHELVPCADLRAEAKLLLEAEDARLAAAQPPAQAVVQPAPDATSPPSHAPNGGSPAQDSSETRKRPRGAAPNGKVWQDGGWVDQRHAKRTESPATDCTLKAKPRGKPPKGKVWDSQAGDWVALASRLGKRAEPNSSPADENSPPRARNTRKRV